MGGRGTFEPRLRSSVRHGQGSSSGSSVGRKGVVGGSRVLLRGAWEAGHSHRIARVVQRLTCSLTPDLTGYARVDHRLCSPGYVRVAGRECRRSSRGADLPRDGIPRAQRDRGRWGGDPRRPNRGGSAGGGGSPSEPHQVQDAPSAPSYARGEKLGPFPAWGGSSGRAHKGVCGWRRQRGASVAMTGA